MELRYAIYSYVKWSTFFYCSIFAHGFARVSDFVSWKSVVFLYKKVFFVSKFLEVILHN